MAAVPATKPARPWRRSGSRRRGSQLLGLLLLPPISWLVVFFLVPVVYVGMYSVGLKTQLIGGETGFTLDRWSDFLSGSVNLGLFWKSVKLATIVSVLAVVIAYPIAYALAMMVGRRRYTLVLIVIAPFLTSYLLRILAWKLILGDNGVINSLAFSTGVRANGDPIPQLLFSQFTVVIVLLYAWVPFVVLPIFVVLETVNHRVLEAAADLGASRRQTFLRITLPLSLPGVFAGFIFVFIPTIGEFVTPLLVGGTSGFMYGNAIRNLFTSSYDWQTGAVLATFLLLVVVLLISAVGRFVRTEATV